MKKPIIISIIAIILILTLILIIIFANSNNDEQPSESIPTSEEPILSKELELFIIDNTPADVYVDIEAGAGNPANDLPWGEDEFPEWDSSFVYIVAIG